MWKVAFWFLQFPAETCALHAVCVFGHLLLAVQSLKNFKASLEGEKKLFYLGTFSRSTQ